jgi:hypothetical protein
MDIVAAKDIQATGEFMKDPEGDEKRVMLFQTPQGMALPTNWSFGQICSLSGFDRRTALRTHPQIASAGINYGMEHFTDVDQYQTLTMKQDGEEVALFRAATGKGYGRIYDHSVVKAVMDLNEAQGGIWKIPAASYATSNPRRATTLYASDRDVFMFLVDENTPIEVPHPNRPDGKEVLFRGFYMWNSEVGSTSWGLTTFLYNFVCDNRIIWGAQDVKELRIRHTSGAPERFVREGMPMLERYAEATLDKTQETIQKAIGTKVGSNDEEVLGWLRDRGFTKGKGQQLIKQATAEEGEARTIWDLVQGGTALARSMQHADSRVFEEREASKLLNRV